MPKELQRPPPNSASRELTPAQSNFAKAIARDLETVWHDRCKFDLQVPANKPAQANKSSESSVDKPTANRL